MSSGNLRRRSNDPLHPLLWKPITGSISGGSPVVITVALISRRERARACPEGSVPAFIAVVVCFVFHITDIKSLTENNLGKNLLGRHWGRTMGHFKCIQEGTENRNGLSNQDPSHAGTKYSITWTYWRHLTFKPQRYAPDTPGLMAVS